MPVRESKVADAACVKFQSREVVRERVRDAARIKKNDPGLGFQPRAVAPFGQKLLAYRMVSTTIVKRMAGSFIRVFEKRRTGRLSKV